MDYYARAQRYRPQTVAELYAAIEQLHVDGLKPRDIAEALRLPLASIIQFLYEDFQQ